MGMLLYEPLSGDKEVTTHAKTYSYFAISAT